MSVLAQVVGARTVAFAPTIRGMCAEVFKNSPKILSIVTNHRLEQIWDRAFAGVHLRRLWLNAPLKNVQEGTFDGLSAGLVHVGAQCCVSRLELSGECAIVPELSTAVENETLERLRHLCQVVLPKGVVEIGDFWFCGSGV